MIDFITLPGLLADDDYDILQNLKRFINEGLELMYLDPVKLEIRAASSSFQNFPWKQGLFSVTSVILIQPDPINHLGYSPEVWTWKIDSPNGVGVQEFLEGVFRLKKDKYCNHSNLVSSIFFGGLNDEGYLRVVLDFEYD